MRSYILPACAAACALVLVGSVISTATADVQTPAKQRCLVKVTASGLKVAKAQAREVRACVAVAARGGISSGTGLACLLADPRRRVAASRAKTFLTVGSSCTTPPDFGFPGATVVNDAAVDEEIGVVRDMYGPDFVAAVLSADVDPAASKCQAAAQRAYERLLATKLKTFGKCEKAGLKTAQIASAAELAGCLDDTRDAADKKIAKSLAKLRSDLDKRCATVALASAFPGRCATSLTTADLAACAAEVVDCRACNMLSAMLDLDADCDAFDDGLSNASCLAGIDIPTTTLPAGAGACTNPADESVLMTVDIQAETRTCTLQCLTSQTREQCIASCVVNRTGLGAGCALCYAGSANCGVLNCAGPCALDQSSPGCVSCLEDAGCIDEFDLCAGTGIVTTTTVAPGSTTTTSFPGSTTTITLGPGGACANAADEAVAATFDLQAEATTCTLGCLSAPDLPQCVADCVATETGLSGECALCYGESSECGIANCAGECAIDQSAPACVACLDANCIPAFAHCADGSTTTTLDTTTTTTVTVTTTTLPGGTTTTFPPAEGACTNPADEAVVGAVDIQAETTTCTLGCLSAPDIAQCTADCLATATGLSGECALCYGGSAECGIANCAGECAINQSAPACVSCLQANCIPAFDQCAGVPTATTTTTLGQGTTTTTTTTTTLPPAGACDNAADEAVDASFDLQAETTTCTIQCLSSDNRVACVNACLVAATGLSSDCSQCYANSSECGLQNCASECAVNQSSAPCQACLEANCIPAFEACSGLGDPPPPATCTNGLLDGDETALDCGGSCAPCAIGQSCGVGPDCRSGECIAGFCSPPTTPLALGSCANGYIDPFTDADAVDLGGTSFSGSDDGYVVTLASTSDVFIELTNQLGATTTLRAALLAVPDNSASTVAGLQTGAVVAGQNGTGGPASVGAGTYYLYVDSEIPSTFGPYRVCVVPAPSVALGTCVTGTVGNGDGNDVQIAGADGAGGDKGLRFTTPSNTNVIVRLRNLSGASRMAAGIFNGTVLLGASETGDAPLFTERTAGPATVAGGVAYTVQVDTAEADSFGTFEVCVVQAGCGDGLVTAGEQCDDGNQTAGDGCSASCTLESGSIVVNSCRTDHIPLFGSDCDDFTLPIAGNQNVFVELANPAGDTLLARGELRLGGAVLAQTGNVPIGQTGSTPVTAVTTNSYTVRVCDVTGAGTGTYTVCVRPARRIELGQCFSSNVTDGDGNVIDLAGPISGGDEDVIFQPPATTIVRLTLFNESVGGLLASGIYDGQPGSLLPSSAVGASPSPLAVGQSGQSGLVEVNVGQVYRVYTDIASLGTAGTDYTICLAEVEGDACLNPEDEAVRAAYNLDAEAESAGLACTGNASCISQAMQNDTGLSAGCADCYGGTGGCAASNCALQCIGSSSSSGCRNCVASNCAAEFEICSGWTYQQ